MAEMFKVNAPVRKPLFEGVQGENEARSIVFDITPWVEELGDGAVTATAKRSQDSQPYPVTVTKDGTTVTWKPTSTDTAFAGVGSFQLEYTVDSVLAKTCIWSTMVAPSLDPAGDPPDPYDNWLAEMRQIAADALQDAQDADASAQDAEAWAKGTKNGTPVPSTADQYENNAKYYSETAAATISDVKSDLQDMNTEVSQKIPFTSKKAHTTDSQAQISFPNTGYIVDEDGTLYAQSGYASTDYIDIANVTGIYRTGTTTRFTLWRYAFYDENKTFISADGQTTNYDIVEYNGLQVTWLNMVEGARYVRICMDTSRPYTYYTVDSTEIVDSYSVKPLIIDEVTELKSINIFNPSNFKANGYYLNFTDGETHIANDYYLMTTDKIHTGLVEKIYVKQIFSTTSTNNFLVYCYAGDTYLGYISKSYAEYGSDFVVNVKEGTTDIRVFSNVTDGSLTGNMICISTYRLNDFVAYNEKVKIISSALPLVYTSVLANKNVVFMGDSIFGNVQTISGVANLFAKYTGANVANFAFGGTQATLHTGSSPYALGWQKFDGVSIAEAIADGDFSDQESALSGGAMSEPAYFATTLAKLKTYDFSKCDYIIADWGTNDWTGGASIANYQIALQTIVSAILTAYPNIVFIEVTPFIRFFEESGTFYNSSVYDYRNDGVYLDDFAEAVSILKEQPYNLQVIDCYNIGINNYTRTGFFSNNDWTHHDDRGRDRIAKYLANNIC